MRQVTEWTMVIEGHNQIWLKMSFYEKVLMIINYFVGGNILRNSKYNCIFLTMKYLFELYLQKDYYSLIIFLRRWILLFTAIAKDFDASSEFIHTKIGRVNSMNKSSIDMYEKLFVISYRLKFIHRRNRSIVMILCFFKLVNILPYLICVEMISFWNPW